MRSQVFIQATIASVLCTAALSQIAAAEARPNVLWITSEDNASHWMGCYGNQDANTPHIDELARRSVRFTSAYSNAPVCAVARCTILHGAYATTLGTQHMRSRFAIPERFVPHVSYLRNLGYFCTNNGKTDYNRRGDDQSIWDECGREAHYRNRANDQPFYAVFNLTVCHESCLFPESVSRRREQGVIPPTPRLDPATVRLPPYVPDLPEVRTDFAIYHDYVTAMDRQVGDILDELAEADLADDTIVFYYSDHGGPTPRGKRYLKDTGVKVPLLVHIPKKWQQLSPFAAGTTSDELVAFVDLAPTLLSICGVQPPSQMQGRAFLGAHRVVPPDGATVYLFADRFDEICGMRRGITDGRFKYIRRFTPHLPAAPYSYYQFSMPSWAAWYEAWQAGQLEDRHRLIWERPQSTEELFDTSADPWEVNNLANDPQYEQQLGKMRHRLRALMAELADTGLIPESMFAELAGDGTLYDAIQDGRIRLSGVLDLAFATGERNAARLPQFVDALDSPNPIRRFWGIHGCMILGDRAKSARDQLRALIGDDRLPANRIHAAVALIEMGDDSDIVTAALLSELDQASTDAVGLQIVNAITQMGAESKLPQVWLEQVVTDASSRKYLKRFASRLLESRELGLESAFGVRRPK